LGFACLSAPPYDALMDELALTERLVAFDTSSPQGLRRASEFVGGWLESRDIHVDQIESRGLPVTMAEVGPADAPTLVLHGHLDVVPGEKEMFKSKLDGDRLYGRGTYDMKGALAVMLLVIHDLREQDKVRVRLGIVSDEESEEEENRGSDALVESGFIGDYAITGETTNLQVGVQAKGVLAIRLEVHGRSAHGATPWLGDNAVVKAVEIFKGIESLPFARQSSALFDRPSINLGRIWGGDALNKVPDTCVMDVDIRFLPEQDPEEVLQQVKDLPDTRVLATFRRPPAVVEPESPYVQGLCEATSPHHPERVMSVGRDGASDAVSFLNVGVPAVEFGPVGDGHHGPEEWVSASSLRGYRQALNGFVAEFPGMVPA
jgi:succinyl-diaminopimelate desuccinylase